ncbi:hypothetical protein GC194_03705 [bacterium]|nr:hypothetical protein [bacterium]
MNQLKHIAVAAFILLATVFITKYSSAENPWLIGFVVFSSLLFVTNILIRNSLAFKGYFTSRYNIFTAKYRKKIVVDLPPDLAFEKIKELLEDSEFKLKASDATSRQLLAVTPISLLSWGENLYFDFYPAGNKTEVEICSAAMFQVYTWGRNERNFNRFISSFENSLTI